MMEHEVAALTYRYKLLENHVLIAERNYYSKETKEREKAVFDSFVETIKIMGYEYNKKSGKVERVV